MCVREQRSERAQVCVCESKGASKRKCVCARASVCVREQKECCESEGVPHDSCERGTSLLRDLARVFCEQSAALLRDAVRVSLAGVVSRQDRLSYLLRDWSLRLESYESERVSQDSFDSLTSPSFEGVEGVL